MAKWNRGEFDPNEKVRIVLIVDPKDPDNEELLKFHREIPWGAGNNTYLSIIRESEQVKGMVTGKGKQRSTASAQPRKAAAAPVSEVSRAAPPPPAESRQVTAEREPEQDMNADNAHATNRVQDKENSSGGDGSAPNKEVTEAVQKTSFSERAANQFDMADDE